MPLAPEITTFLKNLDHLGVTWELADNPVAARLALLSHLQSLNRHEVLSWKQHALPLEGLAEAFNDLGFKLVTLRKEKLNPEWMVGLTSADAALADTGSLVLRSAPGQSWFPALMTMDHVVLLPASRLFPDLASWRADWQAHRSDDFGSTLIITGRSFSDDIEFHRHFGMFGPARQHVIVFSDE